METYPRSLELSVAVRTWPAGIANQPSTAAYETDLKKTSVSLRNCSAMMPIIPKQKRPLYSHGKNSDWSPGTRRSISQDVLRTRLDEVSLGL